MPRVHAVEVAERGDGRHETLRGAFDVSDDSHQGGRIIA
jgi:hypothetical protein